MKFVTLPFTTILVFCCAAFGVAERSPSSRNGVQHRTNKLPVKEIGGELVSIEDFPYSAAVTTSSIHYGTATIINANWLLTSAWVLSFESSARIIVRIGSNSSDHDGETYRIEKAIIHPNFTNSWAYDIGLMKLAQPLVFDESKKPIEIASETPEDGEIGIISGFGPGESKSTENSSIFEARLRAAKLNVMSNTKCEQYYQKFPTFTDKSFCTVSNRTKELNSCSFDYGSPLVYKNKLVGIFSTSPQCFDGNFPAVFSDLSQMKNWVQDTIKKNAN